MVHDNIIDSVCFCMCRIRKLSISGVGVIILGGQSANAEGASHTRGVREHAPPGNFEI